MRAMLVNESLDQLFEAKKKKDEKPPVKKVDPKEAKKEKMTFLANKIKELEKELKGKNSPMAKKRLEASLADQKAKLEAWKKKA